MRLNTKIQLSLMMFLQFFIWGAWFVTLATFLAQNFAASGSDIALAYSTQPWGAIIAPFIIGLIADRHFNAEKILGILHIIGAILMFQMAKADSFSVFYPYVLAYMIAYMPTLALVNSISFNQMDDPSKDFPLIRLWGTIGWIAAGLLISLVFAWDSIENIAAGALNNTFYLVAITSLVLGVYSFTLPKTPPARKGENNASMYEILGLEALQLLKDRNFLIFFISSILICIPLAFYYQNIGQFLTELQIENSTAWISSGQVSEVFFMLLLPFFFKKYGFKKTILLGMLAWVIRYVFFAIGGADSTFYIILLGILLHGICYDFFFVSGQIYTDSKAGEKHKSAAQGIITLATYGFGMLIGFWVAGKITNKYTLGTSVHDWADIWLFPAVFAFIVMVFFAIFFRDEKITYNE